MDCNFNMGYIFVFTLCVSFALFRRQTAGRSSRDWRLARRMSRDLINMRVLCWRRGNGHWRAGTRSERPLFILYYCLLNPFHKFVQVKYWRNMSFILFFFVVVVFCIGLKTSKWWFGVLFVSHLLVVLSWCHYGTWQTERSKMCYVGEEHYSSSQRALCLLIIIWGYTEFCKILITPQKSSWAVFRVYLSSHWREIIPKLCTVVFRSQN